MNDQIKAGVEVIKDAAKSSDSLIRYIVVSCFVAVVLGFGWVLYLGTTFTLAVVEKMADQTLEREVKETSESLSILTKLAESDAETSVRANDAMNRLADLQDGTADRGKQMTDLLTAQVRAAEQLGTISTMQAASLNDASTERQIASKEREEMVKLLEQMLEVKRAELQAIKDAEENE